MKTRRRLEIKIVGIEAFGWLAVSTIDLGLTKLRLDRARDAGRHLVLKLEDVVDGAVEAVGPDVRAGAGVDELARDPHPVAGLAHAAFEHVAHPQFSRHLPHIDCSAL